MSIAANLGPLSQILALPSSFFGEAAVVALAFSLPAIVAGVWIAATRLVQRLGGRTVSVVAGALVIAVGFGAAMHLAAPPTDMTSLVRSVAPR